TGHGDDLVFVLCGGEQQTRSPAVASRLHKYRAVRTARGFLVHCGHFAAPPLLAAPNSSSKLRNSSVLSSRRIRNAVIRSVTMPRIMITTMPTRKYRSANGTVD